MMRKRKLSDVCQMHTDFSECMECSKADSSSSAMVVVDTCTESNLGSDNLKSWAELEPEILIIVLQYIKYPEQFKFELVNRHWRNVLTSKYLANVGVVRFESYRNYGIGFYDLIGYLTEIKKKNIGGVSVEVDLQSRRPPLDMVEVSLGLSKISNWNCFEHFEIVISDNRNIEVEPSAFQLSSLFRFILKNAYKLRHLLITKEEENNDGMAMEVDIYQVDISNLCALRQLHMHGYFPINCVANELTSLFLGHVRDVNYDELMGLIGIPAKTLRSLELVDLILNNIKKKSVKRIVFPVLEVMSITGFFTTCELGIDLTESKLKRFVCRAVNVNHGGHPRSHERPLGFNDVNSCINSDIKEFSLECYSKREVMKVMNSFCFGTNCEKLERMTLTNFCLNVYECETIYNLLLALLENACHLRVLELPDFEFDSDQLIEIVKRMKSKIYLHNDCCVVAAGAVHCSVNEFRRQLMRSITMDDFGSESTIKVNAKFREYYLPGPDEEECWVNREIILNSRN